MAKRSNVRAKQKSSPASPNESGVPSSRIAMVAPVPSRPAKVPADADPSLDLATVLQQLGNNRAYTVIARAVDHWIVHFEGDYKPSAVIKIDGKWKIVQVKQ